jgi:hypothetical protein
MVAFLLGGTLSSRDFEIAWPRDHDHIIDPGRGLGVVVAGGLWLIGLPVGSRCFWGHVFPLHRPGGHA